MNKRYQVFVSSTYSDLKDERLKINQTLMEMDCIPAGMELFPAADEEQFEFIKKVINDCDYYLLIIAGRYGSIAPDGISYTEKEYDYAVSKGLKVIALIHDNPGEIPADRCDSDPQILIKLKNFKLKVSDGRLVKYWNNRSELSAIVALSLQKTIKTYPAVGWIRDDRQSKETLLKEINDLRKENKNLSTRNIALDSAPKYKVQDLAGLDELFSVSGTYRMIGLGSYDWNVKRTWQQIFADVAPYLGQYPSQAIVKTQLAISLFNHSSGHRTADNITIEDQDFQTITIQLKALGLIRTNYSKTVGGSMGWFWSLTPEGERLMYETRAIKSNKLKAQN